MICTALEGPLLNVTADLCNTQFLALRNFTVMSPSLKKHGRPKEKGHEAKACGNIGKLFSLGQQSFVVK